ncbi:MAG: response regulator [Opitutus sp.]|nr:response regulator [Opitutus sp.]
MSASRRSYRVSLQAKVMIVVVGVLVALPILTLAMIDLRLRRQMQLDADLALATARGSFEQALAARSQELVVRFRTGTGDQRFLRILRLGDAATMQDFLRRAVLDELRDDTELALFVTTAGEVRGARRDNAAVAPEAFAVTADSYIQAALHGEERTGNLALNSAAYHVVAIPVSPPEGRAGALVFGIRITDMALQNVRPPSSEILVMTDGRVLASTLKDAAQNAAVLRQLADTAATGRDDLLLLGGQRFKPVTGSLDGGDSRQSVRYVLLASAEQRLGAFERTRIALGGLSVTGILVSAGVVWFFVRRITRPLVELRDNAEAVGRGDFSRRLERFSSDECGELAEAFNRMTANLQSSRAELERAMQQVHTTQEQLIQSEKLSAVGQFVAGVAHELNNPLTAVVGFSELLQSMSADEKTHEHVDRIAKSAHRCHKIVHSLLSFARQHPPERRSVDVHVAVDEVLEIMAYDLRTSNVTIARELAPDLPLVLADPHQLQQVFVNILGNARQAMESFQRDGRITIRTRRAGGAVVIEFQDNGPGIKPDHLGRIFDPFFTTKPVGKGTGLGLSLSYGIIQEHGGKITARSEPGQGATFAIELPVVPAVPAAAAIFRGRGSAVPFPTMAAARPPTGRTVLVIDDEIWILELATELLRADGHTVETARGGQQALELLGRRNFDVIVSDWKMPGLNGIRLYEHLLATDAAAARRVLFMTGDVVSDTFEEFLRINALSCLSKPFATSEFSAAVARMLAGPPV